MKFDAAKVNPRKKWFTSKSEAVKVFNYRKTLGWPQFTVDGVYKGVKGSKHPGEYYVGTYLEFINIY